MGWVVNATTWPLYPRERPGTQCIGGWVSPRAGLDRCGISRPALGIFPRTFCIFLNKFDADIYQCSYTNIDSTMSASLSFGRILLFFVYLAIL